MRVVMWMVGASVCSWLAMAIMEEPRTREATLIGMLGPLAVSAASWLMAERTYRRDAARLTAMMIAAFGAKMVFFAMYVTVAIEVLSVRAVPFVVSFVAYFVILYFVEALSLRRLFAS